MDIEDVASTVVDGRAVDQYELVNSPYERALLSHDDDRLVVELYRPDSDDPDVYRFAPVEYNFRGVVHERDRRLVPDDVQDLLYRSGHTLVPHLSFFGGELP